MKVSNIPLDLFNPDVIPKSPGVESVAYIETRDQHQPVKKGTFSQDDNKVLRHAHKGQLLQTQCGSVKSRVDIAHRRYYHILNWLMGSHVSIKSLLMLKLCTNGLGVNRSIFLRQELGELAFYTQVRKRIFGKVIEFFTRY